MMPTVRMWFVCCKHVLSSFVHLLQINPSVIEVIIDFINASETTFQMQVNKSHNSLMIEPQQTKHNKAVYKCYET